MSIPTGGWCDDDGVALLLIGLFRPRPMHVKRGIETDQPIEGEGGQKAVEYEPRAREWCTPSLREDSNADITPHKPTRCVSLSVTIGVESICFVGITCSNSSNGNIPTHVCVCLPPSIWRDTSTNDITNTDALKTILRSIHIANVPPLV